MKEKIKVNFVDFWDRYIKTDNYFYNLLSTSYDVIIDENEPDIVFFSVDYSGKSEIKKYLGTNSRLIFYTGENLLPGDYKFRQNTFLPSWDEIDLGFTFSYGDHGGKNYRLPLWVMYLNWFDRPYTEERDQAYLHNPNLLLEPNSRTKKQKFCNFVYSNMKGRRLSFFPTLNENFSGLVESSGSVYNNTGTKVAGRGDTIHKIQYLDQFKYTISFENESSPGYQTEKIIHPMMANSLPIYWGNDTPETDFNIKSFIFCNNLTDEEICNKIKQIENDNELYNYILDQPWFVDNKFPEYVIPENILKRIEQIL